MPKPPAFNASAERACIAEALLSSAARLISGRSEREIVQGVCEALAATTPHIRLAWTWFGPKDTEIIKPQIFAGPASAYAQEICIQRNFLTNMGPAFKGLNGLPSEAFNISPWSVYPPWRRLATEFGIMNVLALPVYSRFSGYSGVFVLYADAENYFNEVGTGLFSALAALFSSVLTVSSERVDIEHSAQHDALTGLLNRHALPQIDRRLHRTQASDPPACVLLLDLDHFKRINDQHGHAMGDQVLQTAARTLQDNVRMRDDVLRWGGEEFLVCLPNAALSDALVVAEKLRQAIADITQPLPVTVSIGVAELPVYCDLTYAASLADEGLLHAKATGRNRVCLTPSAIAP